MKIESTTLPGVHLIHSEKRGDHRGYLVRSYCEEHFEKAKLNTHWIQSSITASPVAGTLRGMHYQKPPFAEIKLIRCLTGAIWDCLVDVRPESSTFGKWEAFELSEENGLSLYVPAGVAHGFFTLTADVRMLYAMSAAYSAPHAAGVRWNDCKLAIKWPGEPTVIADRDNEWPLLPES